MLRPPLPLSAVSPGLGDGGSLRMRCGKEIWPHPDTVLIEKCKANWWDWSAEDQGVSSLEEAEWDPAQERMLPSPGHAKQSVDGGW